MIVSVQVRSLVRWMPLPSCAVQLRHVEVQGVAVFATDPSRLLMLV
jgi:hypothetical protein